MKVKIFEEKTESDELLVALRCYTPGEVTLVVVDADGVLVVGGNIFTLSKYGIRRHYCTTVNTGLPLDDGGRVALTTK